MKGFRTQWKKVGAAVLSILVLIGILAGCGSKEDSSGSSKKVVLNEVAHSIFYAPMYVAIEEGYLKRKGFHLPWLPDLVLTRL